MLTFVRKGRLTAGEVASSYQVSERLTHPVMAAVVAAIRACKLSVAWYHVPTNFGARFS